jgi:hypothetical protein
MAEDDVQPKIIVDEDWKSQVQAEKEALASKQPITDASATHAEPKRRGPLPPPSLTTLVTMLATQATFSLGAAPNPLSGKVEADLEEARHLIDLLQVLEDKTRGNCTPQESMLLARVLDDLRLAFVSVQSQSPAPSGGPAAT